MPSNKKYSIAEAAQKLGVTRQAVHTAIQEKRLKAKHGTFEIQRIFKVKGWIIGEEARGHMVTVFAYEAYSAADKKLEPAPKKDRRTLQQQSCLGDEYVCQLLQLCMCTCWNDQWCRGRKLFLPNRRVVDR